MFLGKGMKREIVIEVEQVRLVRKRTSSQLRYCVECHRHTDFVSLRRAAELFERDKDEMALFIRTNACHIQRHFNEIQICLVALLGAIETVIHKPRIRIIGDMKK